MVSAMHKQTVFTVIVTVCAVIGVVLWELGLQAETEAQAVKNSIITPPRTDWSNYFEASLLCSVLIALYIRFYASYYSLPKINRALSLACILLFAAVVVVLVKTAPCGTAYEDGKPCFEVHTGIAFGFALLDLVVFLVWKCLFHYHASTGSDLILADDDKQVVNVVKVVEVDVEAAVEKEVEAKSEAAIEKEAEAKEEEAAAEAKKEEEAKEEEEKKEIEKEEEVKEEEAKAEEAEPSEAEPLLQVTVNAEEEKKDEEKKD